MRTLFIAAVAAAALGTVPAATAIYDALGSSTGTNTGGAFTYGTFNGTGFTAFNDTPCCAWLINNVICTRNGYLPAAFKSTSGAQQSGTVIVPADALIRHPGPNAGQASAVLFTAPRMGSYTLTISAFIADSDPSGVNIIAFSPDSFATGLGTLTSSTGCSVVRGRVCTSPVSCSASRSTMTASNITTRPASVPPPPPFPSRRRGRGWSSASA